MGMDSSMMNGGMGGGMMAFSWLLYILVVVTLVMAIAALGKYLNRQ